MQHPGQGIVSSDQFIFLSRNSKLARVFQDSTAMRSSSNRQGSPLPAVNRAPHGTHPAATACPKLQAVGSPSLELTRPLAAALMREQTSMRCRARGALLDHEYVRDICAAGAHQHCPFLRD
jgi:hypothetical protein